MPVENSYLMAMALRAKKVPFAHYVFPNGFHGLTAANESYFRGWSGGDYSMEQTMRAAWNVKEGKGVNVSEKRREEIVAQFFGGQTWEMGELDESLIEDVGKWIDLACAWMKRI